MKRFANIVLLLSVLLITVQPKLVLHFCGDEFVTFYLDQSPTLVQHDCNQENHCESGAVCKKTTQGSTDSCPKRNLVVVDVDANDYTPAELLSHTVHTLTVDVCLPETTPFLLSTKTVRATLWKLPPKNLVSHSGRAILARHCILTI